MRFMSPSRRRFIRWSLRCAFFFALGSLVLTGCSAWNPRGDSFGDASSTWAKNLRPPTSGGMYGYSTRAQEIEQNLGVR